MQAHWQLILAGLGIGFVMSAPIGPVNFLCFHRTLHRGLLAGLSIGAGAVTADVLFASIAVFGLKAARAFIDLHFTVLQLSGGFVLLGFGLYLLFHKPAEAQAPQTKQKRWRYVLSGFLLSITNPGNFFGFLAMFSGLSQFVATDEISLRGAPLIAGVFIGAVCWWLTFSAVTFYLRNKMTRTALLRINKIAGAIILALGFLLVARYFIMKMLVTGV